GTHTDDRKFCACGEAFYCSRECQRAHWTAEHRQKCCYAETGVVHAQGAIKIEDLAFALSSARVAILRHAIRLAREIETLQVEQKNAPVEKQPCIHVDL
ncbi:hypothetical protein GGG16DRAFT_37143, partial [Schizophyllum commune]